MANGSVVNVEVVIDENKLKKACSEADGLETILLNATDAITARANNLSSGFRTGIWHDHDTGETKGDTPPIYEGDVIYGRKGYVGIVHPGNYSAMKDNYENNTLLKAKG